MKQTFGMYLCVGVADHNEGKFQLESYNPETLGLGNRYSAMVKQVEVEVEVPEQVDLVGLKVKALEDELTKDRAESQRRQNRLMDQISKLKCLTHEA